MPKKKKAQAPVAPVAPVETPAPPASPAPSIAPPFLAPEAWHQLRARLTHVLCGGTYDAQALGTPQDEGTFDRLMVLGCRGLSLGLVPEEAVTKLYLDRRTGAVSMAADLMRGKILAAGHMLCYSLYTDEAVTVFGERVHHGRVISISITVTQQEARRLGSTFSKGLPRHTLAARATSEVGRALFPDVLNNVTYVHEDLESSRNAPISSPEPPGDLHEEEARGGLPPESAKAVDEPPGPREERPAGKKPTSASVSAPLDVPREVPAAAPPPASVAKGASRPKTHVFLVRGQHVYTAGITKEQLETLTTMVKVEPALKERALAWIQDRNMVGAFDLTEAQAGALLADLRGEPEALNANTLTWAQANGELEAVLTELGLDMPVAEAKRVLAMREGFAYDEGTPTQVLGLADTLRQMGVERTTVQQALEELRQKGPA